MATIPEITADFKKVPELRVFYRMVTFVFFLPALTACSAKSDVNSFSSDTSVYEQYSEGDVYRCQTFLNSSGDLEQQSGQDTWATAVGIVRAGYKKRVEAWELVIGSANYEVSELTYADDWSISSSADDFEAAYQDGLDVISNSTDVTEIEVVLTNVLDAFDSLNTVCVDVAG